MSTLPSLSSGDPVTVAWCGRTRYGVVTGDPYPDPMPTGVAFVPVFFDDDATGANVDTRIVTLGYHA